jgi:hypothetical protein
MSSVDRISKRLKRTERTSNHHGHSKGYHNFIRLLEEQQLIPSTYEATAEQDDDQKLADLEWKLRIKHKNSDQLRKEIEKDGLDCKQRRTSKRIVATFLNTVS